VDRKITVTNDPRSEATADDIAELSRVEQQLQTGIATSRRAIDKAGVAAIAALRRYRDFLTSEVSTLNAVLTREGAPAIPAPTAVQGPVCGPGSL
jgi:hypothetical protein